MASSDAIARTSVRELLVRYIHQQRVVEVVFRDSAGQIQTVHARVRDLFTRPGGDFLLLGQSLLIGLDHILTLDGYRIS